MAAATADIPSREAQVKALIRRRYAAGIAQRLQDNDGMARARRAGYSADALARAPKTLVDGWSGCGNLAGCVQIDGAETVVDIGCGSGLDAWLVATSPIPPKQVIALDLTPEMLRGLEQASGAVAACELRVIAGDLERLPLAAACADLVIANAAFNLALDQRRAFAEAARILRPGGRLFAFDLVREQSFAPELMADPMGFTTSLGGVGHEDDLRAALEAAGFSDGAISGHRPFPPVISVRIEARIRTSSAFAPSRA
jgi:SAM-dependent methyltransferase